MSQRNERGAGTERNSALWGTGGRGGDRSSVLWGKGGRGIVVATMVVALAAPMAATAAKGKQPVTPPAPVQPAPAPAPTTDPAPSGGKSDTPDGKTWIATGLLDRAKNHPNDRVDVIVTSSGGSAQADLAVKWLAKLAAKESRGSDFQNTQQTSLSLVDGVSLSLPARWVEKLQQVPGLIVTPDAMVQVSGVVNLQSNQLWPYESGNSALWLGDQAYYSGKTPAIAIVDSGVQKRSDFGARVIAQRQPLDDRREHLARGRARSRHVRGRRRRGRCARPDRCGSDRPDRLDQGDGQERAGEDVRRHQGLSVDPRQQGEVQHPRRELLAALGLRHELLS